MQIFRGFPKTKSFLIYMTVTIIFLLLIEFIFRIIFIIFDRSFDSKRIKFRYLPYITFFNQPTQDLNETNFITDKYGFRINDPNDFEADLLNNKEKNEFRIFILGGSTVHGFFLNKSQDTISSKLEKKLRNVFSENNVKLKPRVINAGVASYFSGSESMLLNFVILNLKPDYVIFFNGSNDFSLWAESNEPHLDFMKNNYTSYQAHLFNNYNNFYTISGVASAITDILSDYSSAVYFLEKSITKKEVFSEIWKSNFSNKEEFFKQIVDKYMDKHIDRYMHNINSSIAIGKSNDVPISYIFQPTLLGDENELSPNEKLILDEINYDNNAKISEWHNVDYIRAKRIFYDLMRRKFKLLQKKYLNDPMVKIGDLSRIFEKKPSNQDYYGDRVHYTNFGREIIVKHMIMQFQSHILDISQNLILEQKEVLNTN